MKVRLLLVLAATLLSVLPAAALHITIDTGATFQSEPTIREASAPNDDYTFGGKLASIVRLPDGTVEISLQGDFILNPTDSLVGVGSFPVILQVGNDVTIHDGATVDFSATSTTPGAGGGGGRLGAPGKRGGSGGLGGSGGSYGIGGVGGTGFGSFLIFFNITTPGTPAGSGKDGKAGRLGAQGTKGSNGLPGLVGGGWNGTSGGGAAGRASNPAPTPQNSSQRLPGGAGGGIAPGSYPPAVYIENPDFRAKVYKNAPVDVTNTDLFVDYYYDGQPGAAGTGAPVENPKPAVPVDSQNHGTGGSNDAPAWALSGGASGGSGASGSGGGGGAGGGGGGGGAGGQGEWMEPFPTTWIEIASTLGGAGAEKGVEEGLEAFFKRIAKERDFDFKLPDIELGSSGARGGIGGSGGDGGDGGDGGRAGNGGAGGGALMIVAQGIINFQGTGTVRGGAGTNGEAGEAEELGEGGSPSFVGPGERLGPVGFASAVEALFTGGGEYADPNSGEGGAGASGGRGYNGDPGAPGGDGGGGAAGTLILKGSKVTGDGTFDLRGGDATNAGGDGRLFVATNKVGATDLAGFLANDAEFTLLGGGSLPTTDTRNGPRAPNPFVAGSPDVPTLPGLLGGAEAFGNTGLANDASQFDVVAELGPDEELVPVMPIRFPQAGEEQLQTVTLPSTTPQASVVAVVRTDQPPAAYEDFPGYDYVIVFNARDTPLEDVHFGCNVQRLDASNQPVANPETGKPVPFHTAFRQEGGWTNDPAFGGAGDLLNPILGQAEVFVFLVPEDETLAAPEPDGTTQLGLNFYLSATDVSQDAGGNEIRETYTIEDLHFVNGEILVATFDPGQATVNTLEWDGGANGDWNVADNWNLITDNGDGTETSSDTNLIPDNTTTQAYNVRINLGGATTTQVTQDEKVIIDRFEIGSDTTIDLVDDATPAINTSLTIEKFDIRPDAGLIVNNGSIHLGAVSDQTSLRFSGSGLRLQGNGAITTSVNALNAIEGIRSSDSLIHEAPHSITASGDLGGNSLIFTNDGSITNNPSNTIPLIIDPTGNRFRSQPGFHNRNGSVLVNEGVSTIRLQDGFFQMDDTSTFGFGPSSNAFPQIIELDGVRLRHQHPRFQGPTDLASSLSMDGPARYLLFNGDNVLEDTNLTHPNGGQILLQNANLTLQNSAIRVDDRNVPTLTLTDSTLQSGFLTYDLGLIDPPGPVGPITSATDQADLSFDSSAGYTFGTFALQLGGTANTLGNLTIDGDFAFDPYIDQIKSITANVGFWADGQYAVPRGLVTIDVRDDSDLTLFGSFDHNGWLRTDQSPGSEILIDGTVNVTGKGGWDLGPGRIRGKDLDDGITDRLVLGSDQVLFNPSFNTVELEVVNEGLILGAYFDDPASLQPNPLDPDFKEKLAALREPLIATNRGTLFTGFGFPGVSSIDFGYGTIDNTGGVIDVGGYFFASDNLSFPQPRSNFRMRNLRVLNGEISTGTFWKDPSFDPAAFAAMQEQLFSASVEGGSVRNCEIIGTSFTSPFHIPITPEEFLLANTEEGLQAPNSWSSTLQVDAVVAAITGIINLQGPADEPLILRDVSLLTHCEFGGTEVSGNLTVGDGVVASFAPLLLADDDYEMSLGTGSVLILRGLTGNPGSLLEIPAGIETRAVHGIGQNTTSLVNNGTLRTASNFVNTGTLSFDPPGEGLLTDTNGELVEVDGGEVGLINRGLISGFVPASEEVGDVELLAGFYDNEGGVIEFAPTATNTISDAIISGGALRGSDPPFPDAPRATVTLNNVILRNVSIANLDLLGTFTIEDTTLENDDAIEEEFLNANITFAGEVRLRRTSPDPLPANIFDFYFENSLDQGNSPGSRIIVASGTKVYLGVSNPIHSLTNFGETLLDGALLTGLAASGEALDGSTQVLNPQTGELAPYSELQALDPTLGDLIPQSNTRIENFGTMTGETGALLGVNFDNSTGSLSLSQGYLYNSFINNLDGQISGSMEMFNSYVQGGSLPAGYLYITTSPTADAQYSPPPFDPAAISTLAQVDVGMDIESEGTLVLLGDVIIRGQLDSLDTLVIGGNVSTVGTFARVETSYSGLVEFAGGTIDSLSAYGTRVTGRGTITESLELGQSSGLIFHLGGTEQGISHDFLDVTGLSEDGSTTASVRLIEDFVPWSGDQFTVFTSDQPLPGTFLTVPSGARIPVTQDGNPAGTILIEYGTAGAPRSVVLSDYQPDPALPPSTPGTRTAWTGGLDVVWLNNDNNSGSLIATLTPATSAGMSVDAAATNNADYHLNFPAASDAVVEGAFVASMAEAFRKNGSGPTSPGTASVSPSGTRYVISTHRTAAAGGPEYDYNTTFGWFPYSQWLGGYASNFPNNGGSINRFESGGRLTHGTSGSPNFLERGGGKFILDLRSVDPDATPENGVLLVCGGRNEDNYAQSEDLGNGTFGIYVRDNGVGGNEFEQDPVSFVYIPFDAVADTELVAAGRIYDTGVVNGVGGVPQLDQSTQNFTVTKGASRGTWYLSIPDHGDSTGTLLVSNEGTEAFTTNSDNLVTHEWDGANNRWIIQSWDIPQTFPDPYTNNPLTLQNGADGINMFSFAFFASDPDPIPPPIFETFHPTLDPGADDNGNGRSNFEDYAAGYDPTEATGIGLQTGFARSAEGVLTLDHPASSEGEDFVVRWERSPDLVHFFSLVEGEDYQVLSTIPVSPNRNRITIELLLDTSELPRQFFAPRYLRKPSLIAP